jgi:hypothetical protein
MNPHPNDDLDRILDETLASMVEGEPLRVSGSSVRHAVGKRHGFALPMWLAAAAVLIVGLVVASRSRVAEPETPARIASAVPSLSPAEPLPAPSLNISPADLAPAQPAASTRFVRATTTEPVYEGLPRLTIYPIELPEPLTTARLVGEPIQLQSIDIAPLSVSTLSNENNQEHQP